MVPISSVPSIDKIRWIDCDLLALSQSKVSITIVHGRQPWFWTMVFESLKISVISTFIERHSIHHSGILTKLTALLWQRERRGFIASEGQTESHLTSCQVELHSTLSPHSPHPDRSLSVKLEIPKRLYNAEIKDYKLYFMIRLPTSGQQKDQKPMDNALNSRRDMSRPNSRSYTPRSQGRNGFGASNL